VTAFLWPVQTYRETIAWCLDYDAAVDLVQQTTDRELYVGEPVYDTPEKRARMGERLNAQAWRIEQLKPREGRARIAA
jgi:hypothetical protein